MFRAKYRSGRLPRIAVAVVAAGAALFTATACEQAQQAISCAELATTLTNDVESLRNVANDPDEARKALDNLQDTLGDKTKDLDSEDAQKAAEGMADKITQLSTRLANGDGIDKDDLQPLVDGVVNLAKVCVK